LAVASFRPQASGATCDLGRTPSPCRQVLLGLPVIDGPHGPGNVETRRVSPVIGFEVRSAVMVSNSSVLMRILQSWFRKHHAGASTEQSPQPF
jgi:hypothetical protein